MLRLLVSYSYSLSPFFLSKIVGLSIITFHVPFLLNFRAEKNDGYPSNELLKLLKISVTTRSKSLITNPETRDTYNACTTSLTRRYFN